MSEGTVTIRCPKCGHPYPMSRLQADVYRGRTMGCMACGRPFAVNIPEPAPDPSELAAATVDAPPVDGGDGAIDSSPDAPATDDAKATAPAAGVKTSPTAAGSKVAARRGGGVHPIDRAAVVAALGFLLALFAAAVAGSAGVAPGKAHESPPPALAMALVTYVAPLLAASACVLGLVGLLRAARSRRNDLADGERPRSGPALAGLMLGVGELAIFGLVAALAWPSLARGLDDNRRAICLGNLQQVGYAAIAEANRRPDGRFPDAVAELVAAKHVDPEAVRCPGAGDEYRYLGKGLGTRPGPGVTPATALTVLAYEPPGHHADGGGHVLFADGAVAYADRARAAAIARELEAGQNPPPSAAAVRK